MIRAHVGHALGLALAFVGSNARADHDFPHVDPRDPDALPDALAPPSVVDLTHRGIAFTLENDLASLRPHPIDGVALPRQLALLTRAEAEATISDRRWYVGLAYETGYGKPPDASSGRFVPAYPEIWTRAVWASPAGLAYGGGVSVVAPVFHRGESSQAAAAAESLRVVRPWDIAPFADNTFTVRPYLDARAIDGRVTLQLRQGLDVQGLVASARQPHTTLVSLTTIFLGYRLLDAVGLGLEASEAYFIAVNSPTIQHLGPNAGDVADDQRAVFALSPSVRLMTRTWQPALSFVFPFEKPLFDKVETYWAARISVTMIWDKSPKPSNLPFLEALSFETECSSRREALLTSLLRIQATYSSSAPFLSKERARAEESRC